MRFPCEVFKPSANICIWLFLFLHLFNETRPHILDHSNKRMPDGLYYRLASLYTRMTWFPVFVIWLAIAVLLAIGWVNLDKKL